MIFRRACLLLTLCALPGTGRADAALPEGFVYLEAVAPTIRQDIRYHGRENFLGARVDGYDAPRCILTRAAAEALARVQAELQPQGLSLKVFDCYRPQRAVTHFLRWARMPDDPALRTRYHPNLSKAQLLREVYIADRSGHSRGSTVDVTIVRITPSPTLPRARWRTMAKASAGHDGCEPEAARRDGALDMGSGFDCFDPVSHTDSPAVTPAQRANRQMLKRLMERQGFRNYAREWWHYTLAQEPFTRQYFDFPVR
ncbi:MAG TPA: M15 family metallopeptidase [Nevskiales bacterium]|nr:M15 family metallopeptidase [Nevskiales bacterium]